MKKKTPMQMRKEGTQKKPAKAASAMDRYAQKRAGQPSVSPVVIESHDPHMDMHTLSRADEIRSNPTRHRAAKQAAKAQIKKLTSVAQ